MKTEMSTLLRPPGPSEKLVLEVYSLVHSGKIATPMELMEALGCVAKNDQDAANLMLSIQTKEIPSSTMLMLYLGYPTKFTNTYERERMEPNDKFVFVI